MSKLPDFEGLAIFAKVVQARSFIGAAAELRLSKATVSKAVSRIEKKFGTRLFNRTARRLAVTEAGRELYDRAAHILAEGEAAENEGITQSAVLRGHVRVTAPISFGVLRIAPVLPEFLELYPDVTVDLHLSDAHVDLVGEGYDAAIRIASLPDSSLIARTLAPVSRHLVAAPSYLSKYGRPSHPLRLTDHRCIAYISTTGETWHFSNAKGETATVRPLGPFRVNNGDAMLPALLAGVGLGILPDFILGEALADGRLEIVLPEWTSSGGSVHWLTPPADAARNGWRCLETSFSACCHRNDYWRSVRCPTRGALPTRRHPPQTLPPPSWHQTNGALQDRESLLCERLQECA